MDIIFAPIRWIISFPFILLSWLIVGSVAGDLARRFMKAVDRPFWEDFVLGIFGAFFGGWIASIVGIGKPDGGIPLVIINLIIATAGAALIIWIRRQVLERRKAK